MKIKTNVRAGTYDRCGGYTRCGGSTRCGGGGGGYDDPWVRPDEVSGGTGF